MYYRTTYRNLFYISSVNKESNNKTKYMVHVNKKTFVTYIKTKYINVPTQSTFFEEKISAHTHFGLTIGKLFNVKAPSLLCNTSIKSEIVTVHYILC